MEDKCFLHEWSSSAHVRCNEARNTSPGVMKSFHGIPSPPVLLPITSARDKKFLTSIEENIKSEVERLSAVGQLDAEQQYIIYGQAFDKVIDYCTDYKRLLTAIKQEYDEFIDATKQGEINAIHVHAKLKKLASEPTTLMYYRKRAAELEDRIEIINKDSIRIEKELQKLKDEKRVKTPPIEEAGPPQDEIDPSAPIPGMTVEDSLNMAALTKYQQLLEEKKRALKAAMKTKYIPIQRKQELDVKLCTALQERDQVELVNQRLLDSYRKKRIIADTIASWARSDKSVSLYETLAQMAAKENEMKDDTSSTNVFEDLDPRKSQEAEALLEYVERFNELFVNGQYKAAAVCAAHSPRGILRNMETMERFRAVVVGKDDVSPLMMFFEALMESSSLAKHPVNAALTLEAIQCALSFEKMELVVHWVTQQRITFSETLGDVILDYGDREPYHKVTCLALAQLIYRKCSSLRKAALSMCLQGQIQGALDYTYQSKRFLLEDYLFLLKKCPTAELINGLTKEWNGKPAVLSVGQAVLSLLCTDHKEYGFQLLESIYQCGEAALEQVILNDVVCTPEGWVEIAEECSNNDYRQLSEKIKSIVISQDGVVEISSKDEDAKMMEHVFL
ncbi:clathrin heavy chain linker domain-containing protein 1 isoform X1 [Hyla sarda]|uniref:clathrin heavy chain linker domain-containing protein 1 isoform X1 n=2 Tax=Hyla sarda TaxID=327740 RepID=UPI0024C41477|nr:clathrin heavy chain linker domain-containing protein 1 isoform X1 [Hyla sarda]XP_056423739.1 clathrin heavy chain linker domain-containing protein 1 isoform X1 [Hyla sarda]